ncbi:MAG: ATP-binding protein, partial [Verrucomicrobiales bacterium]
LDELLTFLRFEESAQGLDLESLDLLAMAQAVQAKVQPFRPELTIVVQTDPQGAATFAGRVSRKYFPRVMENLMMNAMRHANSRVQVTLRREGEMVVVWVDDDGEGIAESDAARIFEPFIRLDPSRDRRT